MADVSKAKKLRERAKKLNRRFNESGDKEALEKAISMGRRALDLVPIPHRHSYMANLATPLWDRYEARGNSADLDEAIQMERDALELVPLGHQVRSARGIRYDIICLIRI